MMHSSRPIPQRNPRLARHVVAGGWLFLGLLTFGCQKTDESKSTLPTPEVTVATPRQQEVVDYEKFTGRTEPVEQVEIRARVSGYLDKIHFQPGAYVKKGDPLFEIDPRPYRTALERAEAEVTQVEARVERLNADVERSRILAGKGALSREDFDKVVGDRAEAVASVRSFKAKVTGAKLDLEFTKVEAPLTGEIGDRLVSEGNLVTGGQGNTTLLTTIVAVDPMDAVFDLDENTLQRLQKAVRDGRIKVKEGAEIPVELGLHVDGSAYPFKGTINFVNNRVNPKSGTIRVKARFGNPKPDVGSRPLTAGMYARMRVPIGEPRTVWMVPESALGTDQGNRFLYVVDEQNKAVRLEVTAGSLEDGLREIENVKGPGDANLRSLRPDDRVIVQGLQRVRTGMTVDPKPVKSK
jgi:RND family efflux transporter MFP subunit